MLVLGLLLTSTLLCFARDAVSEVSEVSEDEPPLPGCFVPVEPPGSNALERLHRSLLASAHGEATTRILHFGDSHVAADLWTARIRHRLQQAFGDAGPGFIGLGRSARRYAHRDLKLSRSRRWKEEWVREKSWREDGLYGLDGVLVSSTRAAEWLRVETSTRGEFGRSLGLMELWYLEQPRGARLRVRVDRRTPRRVRTRSAAVSLGVCRIELAAGPHSFELRQQTRGRLGVLGLVAERRQPGVVYDVLGVNGARAASMLHWSEELFAAQVALRRPDLVILSFGTNEAGDMDDPLPSYEHRLGEVLARVRGAAQDAGCLITGSSDCPLLEPGTGLVLPNPRLPGLIEVQRRVAREHGCAFWDTQAAMGGPLAMADWALADPRLAGQDLVHLNARGYRRLAELFLVALLEPLMPHP